jgi:hypothetical protein
MKYLGSFIFMIHFSQRYIVNNWDLLLIFTLLFSTEPKQMIENFAFDAWWNTPPYRSKTWEYLMNEDVRRAPYLLWRGLNRRERRGKFVFVSSSFFMNFM